MEALPRVSHVYRPGGLIYTLPSQGCVLEVAPTVGTVGGTFIPRTRELEEVPEETRPSGDLMIWYSEVPPPLHM